MDQAVIALGALAGVLAVIAVVFAVLWRRACRAVRAAELDCAAAERERIEAELLLGEQTSRLRVVRELHELVVSSISTLISHADGARYAAKQDPDAAARSAAVIADSARTTLADLRRVMALSREGEVVAGPQPGFDTLGELFEAMRQSGLAVEVRESGERFPLKDGAELAIYRIIQEALSNALVHGGQGTEAVVGLAWVDDGLELTIANDGLRTAAGDDAGEPETSPDDELAALTRPPTGRGITEMRERAELYGGVFTVTANAGVGFTVNVVFPALRVHNGIDGVKLGAE